MNNSDDITYEMQQEKNLELSYHAPTVPQKMSEGQQKLSDLFKIPDDAVEMFIDALMKDEKNG